MQTITRGQVYRLLQGCYTGSECHQVCKKHAIHDKRPVYILETGQGCGLCELRGVTEENVCSYECIVDYRSARFLMPRIFKRCLEEHIEESFVEFVSSTAHGWSIKVPLCVWHGRHISGFMEDNRAKSALIHLPLAALVRVIGIRRRLDRNILFHIWKILMGPQTICIFCHD